MEPKKLFLIDAYAIIYRAYYALIRSPRVTSRGMNTSAIFGFCNTIDEILRKEQPGYLAVCFDPKGGHTFRHDAYPEYKAQRQKQPEDITIAVPYIKRILAAYNIPVIEVEGYEADDVIGTLAHKASADGFVTYMMTPDKDYGQLVTENVLQYRPALGGKGFEIRGPQQICDLYGIPSPDRVIDLLALEGDASDNIPGCPGIGEKTAAKLIAEWGTVENLIENVDKLKGAVQRKIADNVEQILFSKYLVTIKTDVPVNIDLDSLVRKEPDIKALTDIYTELEFKTFLARLNARTILDDASAAPAPPKAVRQASLFDALEPAPAADIVSAPASQTLPAADVIIADTPALVAEHVKQAIEQRTLALIPAVMGEAAMTANMYGLALAYADHTVYIPLAAPGFGREETLTEITPLLANTDVTIISDDVKRDIILLRREGIVYNANYYDISVAHYLLKPEMKHDIDAVAMDMLNVTTPTSDLTALQRRKLTAERLTDAPNILGAHARVCLMLYPVLKQALEQGNLTRLMQEIETPFVAVLASMEWQGARIDVAELHSLSMSLTARLKDLELKAYRLAGTEFNIGSPSQVGEILFGRLQIDPSAKKTSRGAWSTTEEILEKYRKDHEIVDIILKVRALRKLLTTYIDALPKLINPRTGKIHTSYNQTVTATGRISSTNPNLQNIPIRTDDGREIRRAFIPDDGCLIMSADYSQIELRLIADFSNDADMIAAFNSGEDIHRATAAKIYHISPDQVTDNQRRNAKTANFGIIYGISAFGLSQRLDIPRAEAKALIDGYLASYPAVKQYMDDSIDRARESGFVSTIMGRKRYLPDINSRNATVRGYAERNAINAPLQGSAADIIKIAMIRIHNHIIERGLASRMIMQVHDELIFNVVPSELATLQQIVTEDMSGAYSGQVALEVASGVGANWLEAH